MPFYAIRLLGGLMFLSGMFMMFYNLIKTAAIGRQVDARIPSVEAPAHA